jgi:hypothetical protein
MCRSSFGIALLAVAFVAVCGVRPAEAQTALTTCGQEIDGDAYLTGDLTCPPDTEFIVMLRNGHLDLAGFTLSGGEYGVLCARHTGEFAPNGDELVRYVNCSVSNGTIADTTALGVDGREVRLSDVTIAPTTGAEVVFATASHKRLRFTNLVLQLPANGVGFHGTIDGKIEGTNLTMVGGVAAIIQTSKVRIDGLNASGYSDHGIDARSVQLNNSSLTGGSGAVFGVASINTRIESSTVTGHEDFGVAGHHLKVANSTVTGNGIDIQSDRPPKVKNTTCDTSNGWGSRER